MFLCHYVLALSLYVRGIWVITPLPFGEGFGEGHFFFFISCTYNYSINILSFLIFFI